MWQRTTWRSSSCKRDEPVRTPDVAEDDVGSTLGGGTNSLTNSKALSLSVSSTATRASSCAIRSKQLLNCSSKRIWAAREAALDIKRPYIGLQDETNSGPAGASNPQANGAAKLWNLWWAPGKGQCKSQVLKKSSRTELEGRKWATLDNHTAGLQSARVENQIQCDPWRPEKQVSLKTPLPPTTQVGFWPYKSWTLKIAAPPRKVNMGGMYMYKLVIFFFTLIVFWASNALAVLRCKPS